MRPTLMSYRVTDRRSVTPAVQQRGYRVDLSMTTPAGTNLEHLYDTWLSAHRPAMLEPFRAALPYARAAVLARLWGALSREPLPGLTDRLWCDGGLTVTVHGRQLSGPARDAELFSPAQAGLAVGGHEDPAVLARAIWPHAPAFADELDNSVANLALAHAHPPPTGTALGTAAGPQSIPTGPESLIWAEQRVVDGHPLHPCCRTRLGMAPADVLAYAPEHRPTVDLVLVDVPPAQWHTTGAGLPPRLPAHPWQWRRLQHTHPWLRASGRTLRARPLMSLRTFAVPGWHLKTAVDVQMTSAVRTVSAAAVHNGPVVSRLLTALTANRRGLRILRELAAGAVLVEGTPSRSLAVIRREPPRVGANEQAVPLAALAAARTAGRPIVVELIRHGYAGAPHPFLADLTDLLIAPMLRLLALGVALEAHGQNLVLVLRHGRPVRLLYRDMGGIRVSPARLRAAGVDAPPLAGDLTSDDPDVLRAKVFAAMVATVLAELVTVLAREYGAEPATFWTRIARAVPAGTADGAALLHATLPVKATTAMRLSCSPTEDVWASVPNPLADVT
jgi:staphyloferrin A synthase